MSRASKQMHAPRIGLGMKIHQRPDMSPPQSALLLRQRGKINQRVGID